jgi:hypothetical protein
LLSLAPEAQHKVLRANIAFCEPPIVVEAAVLDELEAAYGSVEKKELPIDPLPNPKQVEVGREIRAAASVPWFTPKET